MSLPDSIFAPTQRVLQDDLLPLLRHWYPHDDSSQTQVLSNLKGGLPLMRWCLPLRSWDHGVTVSRSTLVKRGRCFGSNIETDRTSIRICPSEGKYSCLGTSFHSVTSLIIDGLRHRCLQEVLSGMLRPRQYHQASLRNHCNFAREAQRVFRVDSSSLAVLDKLETTLIGRLTRATGKSSSSSPVSSARTFPPMLRAHIEEEALDCMYE